MAQYSDRALSCGGVVYGRGGSGLSITFVAGDIFLSSAQVIALGHNARGRQENNALTIELAYRYPAAFATYRKQIRAGRLHPGDYWMWREASPWLAMLIVRNAGVSATRTRHVEEVVQKLARDWQREGLTSLAIIRFGDTGEWPAIRAVLAYWLDTITLPVVVYETHQPGIRAPEAWDSAD